MGAQEPLTPAAPRRRRHRILVGAAWAAVVGGYQLWAWRSGLGPTESVRRLVEVLQDSAWGLVVYSVVYVLRPLVLFSAAVLTVAGGFLFGPWIGLAVVLVASNASAMLAFGIGRWFGAPAPAGGMAAGSLERYAHRLRTRSFATVVVLRLLLVPYDLVSYLAGFLRIGPAAFLLGTAVGSLPGTVAFVLFGASIEQFGGGVPSIDARTLAASAILMVASLVMVRVVRRREAADAA